MKMTTPSGVTTTVLPYVCEICGFEVDEIEDIAWVPTPSILDPGAHTRMCRDCGEEYDALDHFDAFEISEDTFEELDPIFLEEMFGDDELD